MWGESTSDKEVHDNHTSGGQKGAFGLSLWLNIVCFYIRGTLSALFDIVVEKIAVMW
jgi:hypothetical protein